MRRAAVAAIIATLALAGCAAGEDEPSGTSSAENTTTTSPTSETPSETPSESASMTEPASPSPTAEETEESHDAIEIEIEGDKITPNGKRVEVPVGGHVLLEIDSDRAGELHVHSSPEQMLAFKKGESTVELTIDRPGVVDVEEHESGVVILQLEVS